MAIHAVTTFDELCAEFVTVMVNKCNLSTTQATTLTTALAKRPGFVSNEMFSKQFYLTKNYF